MNIPEMIDQLAKWGVDVKILATDAGPTLAAYPRKDRPVQESKARNLMAVIRKQEPAVIRFLTCPPKPFEMPASLEARAAELQAQLTDHFDETPATAKAVYELNIILEMMSEPGCQTSDVFGKPWKELYLEAQM